MSENSMRIRESLREFLRAFLHADHAIGDNAYEKFGDWYVVLDVDSPCDLTEDLPGVKYVISAAASESVNADGVCTGPSIRWLGWLTEDVDIGVIESNLLGEEGVP